MSALTVGRRRGAWTTDPVFSTPQEVQGFSRLAWDVRPMSDFGLLEIPLDRQDSPQIEADQATQANSREAPSRVGQTDGPKALDLLAAASPASPLESIAPIATADTIEANRADALRLATALAESEAREAQAYERGFGEGRAAGLQAAQENALTEQLPVLRALLESLHAWRDSTEQIHAPLYRLALRLAQALVRTELSLSSQAIHQLVAGAIDTLSPAGPGVLVTLNPDDWDQLRRDLADADLPWRVDTDPELSRGSVRVSSDDAMVEDLLEDRLEALARALFKPLAST
jgi:flagellar biosynthesis/type III secretory pathway protein FliH